MSQSNPKPVHIGRYVDAVYPSYAMMAGMQLGIFTALKDGPLSAAQVAQSLGVSAEKVAPLLYALAAAELLTVEDGRFANTDESDFYLVEGRPGYLGDIHWVISPLWQAASLTAETVRTGEPQAKLDYHLDSLSDQEKAVFQGLHRLALLAASDLQHTLDLSTHRHLIDIGGGTGGLAIGLTQALPDLTVTVLDLPAIMPLAREYVAQAKTADRIRLVTSDVVHSPIEGQYDGALMRSFTQVLSPEDNRAALRHTYAALKPGGRLYIMARAIDDNRVTPADTALLNLALVGMYDAGQAYTESEYRQWIEAAGFVDFERRAPKRGDSLITARRPESPGQGGSDV